MAKAPIPMQEIVLLSTMIKADFPMTVAMRLVSINASLIVRGALT
jgi:hypothetical protein